MGKDLLMVKDISDWNLKQGMAAPGCSRNREVKKKRKEKERKWKYVFCTMNSWYFKLVSCQPSLVVSPYHSISPTHWSYCSLVLSHWYAVKDSSLSKPFCSQWKHGSCLETGCHWSGADDLGKSRPITNGLCNVLTKAQQAGLILVAALRLLLSVVRHSMITC